jgi:outer membrane protein assembly factor BamB
MTASRSKCAYVLCAVWAAIPLCSTAYAAEPAWTTYRGNPARTGNSDGKAGPEKPAVLWVVKSQDYFVASPVPVGERLFVSGIGGFNRPTIALFPFAAKGPMAQPVWSKSAPYLKLPTVSSPAHSAEKNVLIFGDGMHQDSGGLLHCLAADTGRPLWQLPVPGELVHLEGAPTIANGKVYVGGGAAGILCVELDKAIFDGKEHDLAAIAKLQSARWQQLLDDYEVQKKKDPDFAIPPSDDQLLKPSPKKVWQKGAGKWHVDAAVNVVGDRVLVPTSYLDKEKIGERALYCLNAATGATIWKADLALNPWGGASVGGDTVVVPGSSIGYYFNEIKGAKGDLTAFDLATGKEKWKKPVPGGVVGCVAIADGLAVCTATDGKVRAYRLADGDRAWLFDAKMPFFAPPAIAGGAVYAADLMGTVHALDLKTGTPKWSLALAKDPAVMAPGMVYGGVAIQDGKLVVATCNLEGPFARKETAIVCIGQK